VTCRSSQINGLVAVLFRAGDEREARSRSKAELMTGYTYPRLEVDGRPLWDGKSKVKVRLASGEEARFWHLQRVEVLAEHRNYIEYDDVDLSVFPYPVVYREKVSCG